MQHFSGLEHLESAVGTHLGDSEWHQISQDQIDAFADATGDQQWIHVDRERAEGGPFGATIAHGFLTVALIPVLVWRVLRIDGLSMQLNYGLNKVRFPKPALANTRIKAGIDLLALESGVSARQMILRVTMESEAGGKPVCVAETVTLLVP